MVELGQLEDYHAEFEKRKTRIVAVSIEDVEDAAKTQADFPHLAIVSDAKKSLTDAVDVVHRHSDPNGGDTSAPTTLLIDGKGVVRWVYRPDRVFTRLFPSQLAAKIDEFLPTR